MRIQFAIAAISLMNIWMLSACKHESGHDHETEETDAHQHSGESHAHNHDDIIIEPEDAERFGIETENVELRPFNEIITISGQIISSSEGESAVTAGCSGIVTLRNGLAIGQKITAGQSLGTISAKNLSGGDPNQAAKIAVASAKREVDRLEPLLKEGIVTQGEYNAALAAYQSAKASYSPAAASGALTAPLSGVINQLMVRSGQYVEVGTPIAMISRGNSLLLSADLPEKYRNLLSEIKGAYFRPSYSKQWISTDSLGGRRIETTATDAVAKAGYIPVVFSMQNNGTLSAGSFVEINLVCRNSEPAIVVPTEALTEQQGAYFIYIKEGDHEYEKRKVEIGESNGQTTRIISGIEPGDEVVVKGAVMVKLAESNGAVPEGHSHNH